jgi:hypothetical protein
VLPAALAADHADRDDLCQIPPNMCDAEVSCRTPGAASS